MNKDEEAIKHLAAQLEYLTRREIEKEKDLITLYSGELHIGDLILVSYTNKAYLGVYLRRGQGGSVQFFSVQQLNEWFNNRTNPNYNLKKGGPPVWYINEPHSDRISKYSEDLLTDYWKDRYDEAKEALKILKVIK